MVGALAADSLSPDSKSLPFGPLPHQDMRMQDPSLKPATGRQSDMVGLFIFIMIMGLSIAVSTVEKWQFTEQKMIKAEAEKAHAELSFLKAQINPHFLFNTLNNIYALSVTDSKNTSASIMKLSNIMRYVTDEVVEDLVSLQSEVDCINDYIDLQRLRLGKKTILNFEVTGAITNQRIAPLVLMTFIENVFKYGISKHEVAKIEMKLNIDGSKLNFFCQNTIFDNGSSGKRKGIGIANTRQRLNHIYPGRHKLDITKENNLFTVNLEIDC
jgi:LytS/YehU family sensor histidine kinase